MCNFSYLVDGSGDVATTLQHIISVQNKIEERHDIEHKSIQQLYGLRWSLKSYPQPADALLPLSITDRRCMVRAGDVAAVEESVRAELRKSLRDHRELKIRRRDLERFVRMISSLH